MCNAVELFRAIKVFSVADVAACPVELCSVCDYQNYSPSRKNNIKLNLVSHSLVSVSVPLPVRFLVLHRSPNFWSLIQL